MSVEVTVVTRHQNSRIAELLLSAMSVYWQFVTQKILSLDGGGTWALIQVEALLTIFGDVEGHEVLKHFNLVAANSGGSIVTGALVANMRLSRIATLFRDREKRLEIFSRKWPQQLRRSLSLPRYVNAEKRLGLRRAMAAEVLDRPMSEWGKSAEARGLPHIVITAFDYDRMRAAFFRTHFESQAASRNKAAPREATFLDAIHASSSAPVKFFDQPSYAPDDAPPEMQRRYWDGAIAGFNNPILAGVIEAKANAKTSDVALRILSIGTGSVLPKPVCGPLPETGFVADIQKVATSILDDPPDAATFMAHVLLGGPLPAPGKAVTHGPIVRLCPVARANGVGRVSDEEYEKLASIELDAVEDDEVEAIAVLCKRWLNDEVPNQPIRPAQDAVADIGHDTFSGAVTQLRTWLSPPTAQRTATHVNETTKRAPAWTSTLASSTPTTP